VLINHWRRLDDPVSRWLTPAVKWIFYICIISFLLQFIFRLPLYEWFGASLASSILSGRVWQLVTYAFVHGSLMHLLFNLLGLYFFGQRIEHRWGSRNFTRFVIVTAAGAVLTHILVSLVFRGYSFERIIGISGVLYAVLFVFAYYYPNEPIYFYFVLKVNARVAVIILGVLALLASAAAAPHDSVAHLTHLGGLLFGYLYIKFPNIFQRLPLPDLTSRRRAAPKSSRFRDLHP